jgi:glutamate carboxypeptidase
MNYSLEGAMNLVKLFSRSIISSLFVVSALTAGVATGAPVESVLTLAKQQQPAFLDTLKSLVSIESGSGDREGLDRISQLIADQLKALGGKVEFIEPGDEVYRMSDTPEKVGRMVHARFEGSGTKKIMLIAHMDTVYLRGMLEKQPFRIDGNRAYGLGIADDKQGIALILHTVAMLKSMNFKDYGVLTVLINGDEEISSPAARSRLTKFGAEHDATFSCEGSLVDSDKLSLSTAGIGAIVLNVTGKASHAGSAPEKGRNALYELSHQVLQMRDLSDPSIGLKLNWTVSKAGDNRNVIPAKATASADVRVLRVADFEAVEPKVKERIKTQLIPDTKVEMLFERRRPPLEKSPASEALAKHAQSVYGELGKQLVVGLTAEGGGTDAAFAALNTKSAVIERFGVQGFGAHTNDAEYILIDSVAPRLYLLTRMIMDVAQGNTQ